MKFVTPEFLTELGFVLRSPNQSDLLPNQEHWDLEWDGLRVCLTLSKNKAGYRDTTHFSATAMLGDKNYGYTKQIHYETLKNDTQTIVITIYKSLTKFARTKLQWDMRRLLAIEEEQPR